MADNNFKGGPGGRLQKEEAKNVNFGFMRPTISPLNQKQFMQVARGEMSPQQESMNAPVWSRAGKYRRKNWSSLVAW